MRKQLPFVLVAAAGVGWGALVYVFYSGIPRAPSARGWVPITGDRVKLVHGTRYRGCVSVPFFIPNALVRGKLVPELQKNGFLDVVVAEDRPASWPDVSCDFFVEATWGGADRELERPSAVPLAWRAA